MARRSSRRYSRSATYESGEINNIIHAGLIFVLYLFASILLYFLLSYPLDLIFGSLSNASVGTPAQAPMALQLPNVRYGLNVAFALGMAFPVVWFILWVFSQEPDFSIFRR